MRFKAFKIGVILACIISPLLSWGSEPVKALFDKGNALYTKGQFAGALNVYRQITASGYQSGAIYFNMGNASYKNGDIPSAILYYEKAHKLAPADEDISYNLKYANLKTTDKVVDSPEFFLNRWWQGLILSFPIGTLAVWSIILTFLGSAMLIAYFFAEAVIIKKVSFYIALIFFTAGVLSMLTAGRQAAYFDDHREAIVFSGSSSVKNSPIERSNTLFVIHDGTKVTILDSSNGWLRIRLANGNEGWIRQSDAKEI